MLPFQYSYHYCVIGTLYFVVGTAKAPSSGNSGAHRVRWLYLERPAGAEKALQFDEGPIVRTETLEAWSDTKEADSDKDDQEEQVDEALVSNDDEDLVGLPSKAERAPSVLIENEKDHIVWAMWGPWGPCSGRCGPGHVRKRIRKCARGACQGGIVEEEVASCHDKPCQTDIEQAASGSSLPF